MKKAESDYKKMKKIYDKMEDGPEKDAAQVRMDQLMLNTVTGLDSIR